ncbi:hypothetical protein CALCODRAFT_536228 [Calocera cornea HHB12733]|uniref:Uncharacterized protein n=1 Tax=Calocera cornea HHB12733 TaxID=1353952 RepID=A0A165HSN6_9BASI|nr:hypothetical protein CALCODRAFT_536228 [Calocera cornea HHB12733]
MTREIDDGTPIDDGSAPADALKAETQDKMSTNGGRPYFELPETTTAYGDLAKTRRDLAEENGRQFAGAVWKLGVATTACWNEMYGLMMSGGYWSEGGGGGKEVMDVTDTLRTEHKDEGAAFRSAGRRHAQILLEAAAGVCQTLWEGVRNGIGITMGERALTIVEGKPDGSA